MILPWCLYELPICTNYIDMIVRQEYKYTCGELYPALSKHDPHMTRSGHPLHLNAGMLALPAIDKELLPPK